MGLEDERVVVVVVRIDGEAVVMLGRFMVCVFDVVFVECVLSVVVAVVAAVGEVLAVDFFRSCVPVLTWFLLPLL